VHGVGVDVPGLVAHFEQFLGPIASGWMKDPDGSHLPFQVVRYARGPDIGSVAYSTLGFSRRPLPSADGTLLRQEFVVLATKSLPVEYVLGMVRDVAVTAAANGRAPQQGDVFGPVPPPVPNSSMVAAYAAMPVYFDDAFATHQNPSGEVVEVVWLVPITTTEARYVRSHGWEGFEDLLADQDPDLVDVYRAEVELPADLLPDLELDLGESAPA
jgi:hypothetical protein